jgi:transposase-like protein
VNIVEAFKEHRWKTSPNGASARYPAPLRQAAAAHCARELARGRNLADVARELGVHYNTLDGWRAASRRTVPAVLRPVTVSETPTGVGVVHALGGVRVEGLSITQIAQLLRALA